VTNLEILSNTFIDKNRYFTYILWRVISLRGAFVGFPGGEMPLLRRHCRSAKPGLAFAVWDYIMLCLGWLIFLEMTPLRGAFVGFPCGKTPFFEAALSPS
jgi:hypothetical protein